LIFSALWDQDRQPDGDVVEDYDSRLPYTCGRSRTRTGYLMYRGQVRQHNTVLTCVCLNRSYHSVALTLQNVAYKSKTQ